MRNREDLGNITKLPFKPFLDDLLSTEPAITKATVEDLSSYFNNDPYFPNTRLPKFFRYKFHMENDITDSSAFKKILSYQNFLSLSITVSGNGNGTRSVCTQGCYYKDEKRKKLVFDRDLMYIYMMGNSGKKNYFYMDSHDETPFLPRENCIVLTQPLSNPLTNSFFKEIVSLGMRFNSSMGTLYGFEEASQILGNQKIQEVIEGLSSSQFLQKIYGYKISENIL